MRLNAYFHFPTTTHLVHNGVLVVLHAQALVLALRWLLLHRQLFATCVALLGVGVVALAAVEAVLDGGLVAHCDESFTFDGRNHQSGSL